ncbi:MAG: HD domain-containing protein [Chloroflexi bacterium]|nr:HD domain-containing protein [Chloroflexota bacterium]
MKVWSGTEQERTGLEACFPRLADISDASLREKVMELWLRLWRESGYRDIGDCPNHPNVTDSLVLHTAAVTEMSLVSGRALERTYHYPLDYDRLLAGAISHDADKLVVFGGAGGTLHRDEVHGQYAASLAGRVGLPPEVVNIIASHSAMHPVAVPQTVEAVIVADCDHAAFRAFRLMKGLPL